MFVIWFDDLAALGGADFSARQWRWWRARGDTEEQGRGDLETIASMLAAAPDDVTLLIAARECVRLALDAPPMSARNLDLALPYLAEDQLAQSVEQTHLARARMQGDQLAVIGISKPLLRTLLDLLSDYAISPVAAFSDAGAIQLPDGDARACLMLDGHRILLRSEQAALETDFVNLPIFLQLVLLPSQTEDAQERLDSGGRAHVKVFCDQDKSLAEKLADIGITASASSAAQSPLAAIAAGGFASADNLLVGEFAPASKGTGNRTWHLPLALAASLLVLVLAADISLGLVAQDRISALQLQAIEQAGNSMSASEVVRLVNREQGGGGQETSYFIDLLAKLSKISSAQGANLKSLSYQQGSRALDVEVLVSDYDDLDSLSQQAQSAFIEADMLGATQTEDGVRARLRLVGLRP